MGDENVKVVSRIVWIEKAPSPLVSSIKASHSPSLETIREEDEDQEIINQDKLSYSSLFPNSSSLLHLLI